MAQTATKNQTFVNSRTFYTKFYPPPDPSIEFKEPSLVQPQFAYEADINNLVQTVTDRDGIQHSVWTGLSSSLPSSQQQPQYGDFTQFTTEKLIEAKNIVATASAQFEALPSNIRDRFENNPSKLIAFLNDESNYDEAVKLGFVKPCPTTPIHDSNIKNPVQPTIPVVPSTTPTNTNTPPVVTPTGGT